MAFSGSRLREVRPSSFIYEMAQALPADVCREAIRRHLVAIRPAQGKLVLFPPFWTHVHRGVTLRRGVTYIATTWICFA